MQLAIVRLSEILGLPVNVQLDWTMMWTTLKAQFQDVETFVPTVVAVIKDCVESFIFLLDTDAHEEWSERLLEGVTSHGQRLNIRVEVRYPNFHYFLEHSHVLDR